MERQKNDREYTFEDLINDQGYIIYTNVGVSMLPLLRQHQDVIEIQKRNERVNKYDVVLYKKEDEYILHRCIAVRPAGYIFAGDHNTYKEYDVTDEMILGIMTKIIRNGKSIYPSSFLYRLYSHLWVDFFPIKVFILKAKKLFLRLGKITPSRIRNHLNWRIIQAVDLFTDYRITGRNLTAARAYQNKTAKKSSLYQPTNYLILNKVFSHVQIVPSDTFIDIGCGKGRTLSYLLSQHCSCRLYGIEAEEELGKTAVDWTKKYENTNIYIHDPFDINYNEYSILCFSQTFHSDTFSRFILLLEEQLKHSIIVICLFDRSCRDFLETREGWVMQYCEDFLKINGLQVVGTTKRFSIWKYNPAERYNMDR